ncbi:MAG: hypothetical protein KDC14_05410, partial [Planctomycetes bacterium]|nr:hypothetical protein [Planctomycetota bacterium]
ALKEKRKVATKRDLDQVPQGRLAELRVTPEFDVSRLTDLSAASSDSGKLLVVSGSSRGFLGFGKHRLIQAFRHHEGVWEAVGKTAKVG